MASKMIHRLHHRPDSADQDQHHHHHHHMATSQSRRKLADSYGSTASFGETSLGGSRVAADDNDDAAADRAERGAATATSGTAGGGDGGDAGDSRLLCSRARKVVRRRLPGLDLGDGSGWTLRNVARDVLYGIPVGISSVPQGIVFAELANLPVEYGLYAGFVGAFVYSVFGSLRVINVGPAAALAIMVGSATMPMTPLCRIMVPNVLCLLGGIFAMILGISRLTILVEAASPAPVVTGVLSAAGLIVMTANTRFFMGLESVKGHNVVQLLTGMYRSFGKYFNYHDAIMGAVSLTVLTFLQHAVKIDFARLLHSRWLGAAVGGIVFFVSLFRTPIWMASCGLVADYVNNRNGYHVFSTAKRVDRTGIPEFDAPSFSTIEMTNITIGGVLVTEPEIRFLDIFSRYYVDMIVIMVFAMVQHVTVVRRHAQRRRVEPEQELFALGLIQVVGSFFHSMPVTAAFTRCGALAGARVQTRIAPFMTAVVVLLALHFFTPYMQYIPKPALGGIVFTGMIPLLQTDEVARIWRAKKFEAIPFGITFAVSLVAGLKWGFISGLSVNLLRLLVLSTRPRFGISKIKAVDGRQVVIVKVDRDLHYHTATSFSDAVSDEIRKCHEENGDSEPSPSNLLVLDLANIVDVDYGVVKSVASVASGCGGGGAVVGQGQQAAGNSASNSTPAVVNGCCEIVLVNVAEELGAALKRMVGFSPAGGAKCSLEMYGPGEDWLEAVFASAEDRRNLRSLIFERNSVHQSHSALQEK